MTEKETHTAQDEASTDGTAPDPAATAPATAEPGPDERVAEYHEMALRARAELDNYRKRVAREKEDAIRYANTSLLEKFLPMVDNFDLGLDAAQAAGDAAAPVVAGFSMVRRQFDDFLREHGVEPIDAPEGAFDHNLHEAVGTEPSDAVPEGHIVRQVRRGYKLKDRLLRPAAVVVSQGPGK